MFLGDFFKRSHNEVREGMDVSVCVYNEETQILKYAGAMNSLYYCAGGVFNEIKGDKKTVGGVQGKNEDRTFTCQEFKVKNDMCFYLSTDGFQDQFGGEENRKFLTKNFKKLLFKIHENPMQEQEKILIEEHLKWRGKNEQVDDILMLGFCF
jgi:serine phosphatase RsbU (regulator of sigma subunit)